MRFDYPKPLDETDKMVLGEWGDPESAVDAVLIHGRGMLVQAEGIVFAYDDDGKLFVNGEIFSPVPLSEASLICDSRCILPETLDSSETLKSLLLKLVSLGYLYGCDKV
mmetsp:Transcript_23312/g.48499  ORF Transcript_23312/g.48499 Transcript_23312/m.48499 type:complete len:109 (+) Transcript_23312:204-530(+)